MKRRELLASSALVALCHVAARADVISNGMPWTPAAGAPPRAVRPGPWHFFTPVEGRTVEAIVDRLIPPDPETVGGKEAGCATYIDRQLAGPFGRAEGQYRDGPFRTGTKEQGDQSPLTPAERYRRALAALDAHCRQAFADRDFAALDDADKDRTLTRLEHGELAIDGVEGPAFFATLVRNAREGFFADPIYGGNRDMAGWRTIGFPGVRYDYSDWIDRHNEPYPLGPVGIAGAPSWTVR